MWEYSERVKVKTNFCPECMDENIKVSFEEKLLERKDGWSQVKYMTPVISCRSCGQVSDAPEHKDASYDAACIAMGGLPPMEIRRIRKELGFTSAEKFADLLGVGKATVKRWEARISFPDRNQIRLINILCTVGSEKFIEFSDIQRLFKGGKIKSAVQDDGFQNTDTKVIDLDGYRKTFSSSAGKMSDNSLYGELGRQALFKDRMIGS